MPLFPPPTTVSAVGVYDVVKHGGAAGDGQWVGDAAVTSGQATVTSATGKFTPGNTNGKSFLLHGASASGDLLTGTLTYVSATSATMSVTAGTTVSGGMLLWGTDDTSAFNTCVTDGLAYAQAHGGAFEVYTPLPPAGSFYVVAGALVTNQSGQAQIPLPPCPDTGQTITMVWNMQGATGAPQSWNSHAPAFTGATIVSFGFYTNATLQGNAVGANGNPSVIGAPTQTSGYGQTDKFSNMVVDFRGTVLTAHSKAGLSYAGLDFSSVKTIIRDAYVATTGSVQRGDYASFSSFGTGYSIGILMPANGNNDLCVIENVTIGGGFSFGIVLTEHTVIGRLCVLYCSGALCPVGNYFSSVGSIHSSVAPLISVEACTWLVQIFGKGSGGVGPTFHYRIDTETSTPRFGDRNGGADMGSARGSVALAGSFTKSGLILDGPPGFDIVDVNGDPTHVTGTYAVNYMDRYLVLDAAGGSFTSTLPTAVDVPTGKVFHFTRIDGSANTATIAAKAGETIKGAASTTLAQWATLTLAAYNGAWVGA